MPQNSDYCTLFPESVLGRDVSKCCKRHDEAYSLQEPKLQSDVELMRCFGDAGVPTIGVAAFIAVSVVGWIFYKKAAMKK